MTDPNRERDLSAVAHADQPHAGNDHAAQSGHDHAAMTTRAPGSDHDHAGMGSAVVVDIPHGGLLDSDG